VGRRRLERVDPYSVERVGREDDQLAAAGGGDGGGDALGTLAWDGAVEAEAHPSIVASAGRRGHRVGCGTRATAGDDDAVDYDVCLSFAGEDRGYVQAVAHALHQRAVRVFYDEYEQAVLWGKDLYVHLDDIYRRRARYCVVFISEHYGKKLWTSHERRSAQARAFSEATEYVLPARFDDAEIRGVLQLYQGIPMAAELPPIERLVDAVCYGVRLIDERIAPFVTKAARVAVRHIDLELLADDHL
jgi:hypothetical protein